MYIHGLGVLGKLKGCVSVVSLVELAGKKKEIWFRLIWCFSKSDKWDLPKLSNLQTAAYERNLRLPYSYYVYVLKWDLVVPGFPSMMTD